ncbi:hypothetical protein [Arcobacter sp. LA11]|uniref:hypothetical protein n=1 Tax=Arcobacter sp. LA11 TaxID=1898176 RepID=UPI00093367EF|nr:hypothetical protein [Arcobacter sp. LA11]
MLKDINIKINGLTEKVSLEVVSALKDIVDNFSSLDFRRLEKIVITSNFERDVESLTSANQTSFKNRYRANQDTYAVVLTIPKKDDFELVLVIKTSFITNILTSHEKQSYKDAFHIIHHELAHIHDNNKKIDIFKDLMKTTKYKGKSSILFPIAEECWSEYIANYISSNSALETQFPKIMAKNLIKKINSASQNIKTQLLAFKINKKRDDLLFSSIEDIKSLLKTAAYLQGYLHGFNMTLEELDYDSDYNLECSYFKDIWEAMQYEFYSMKEIYPDGFINLSIYQDLAFYIDAFFNQMGIVFDMNEKGDLEIKVMY